MNEKVLYDLHILQELLDMKGIKKGTPNYNYDEKGDVLYVSFDKPDSSGCIELDGGIVLRKDPDTKLMTGFTIINYMKRVRDGLLGKIPFFDETILPKF